MGQGSCPIFFETMKEPPRRALFTLAVALLALDFKANDAHNCHIYTVTEPCPMCLGAIYWARPARVYFAATHDDAAWLPVLPW